MIAFTLELTEQVGLKIYDSQGREVQRLYEGEAEAGKPYEFEWQPGDHESGMYVVRVGAGSKMIHKKTVLVR